jgi:hypothetical protein
LLDCDGDDLLDCDCDDLFDRDWPLLFRPLDSDPCAFWLLRCI